MTLTKYVVVVKRKNGENEVLSTTLASSKKQVEEDARWWRTRFLGVEIEVCKCEIEVLEE